MTFARVSSSRCGELRLGRRGEALALERVADERPPVVRPGVALAASARSRRGSAAGSRRGGSPTRGPRTGRRDGGSGRCRRTGSARPARVRADRVGEEGDRLDLVGLDDGVVVLEVLLRHPVGVERRVAAAQERARQPGEAVLVGGGAEVRAAEEHDRVARGDGVADERRAERARRSTAPPWRSRWRRSRPRPRAGGCAGASRAAPRGRARPSTARWCSCPSARAAPSWRPGSGAGRRPRRRSVRARKPSSRACGAPCRRPEAASAAPAAVATASSA